MGYTGGTLLNIYPGNISIFLLNAETLSIVAIDSDLLEAEAHSEIKELEVLEAGA